MTPTVEVVTQRRLYTIYWHGPYVFSAKYMVVEPDGSRGRYCMIGEAYKSLAGAKAACKRWIGDKLNWRTCGDPGREWWEAETLMPMTPGGTK